MGNGDIVVGKDSPKTLTLENVAERASAAAPAAGAKSEQHCGAMTQQRGDTGAISTPQKFVRLVGCRDAKASSHGTD